MYKTIKLLSFLFKNNIYIINYHEKQVFDLYVLLIDKFSNEIITRYKLLKQYFISKPVKD